MNIKSIPLTNIHEPFDVKVSNAYLERMNKAKEDLLEFDLLLAVEKIPDGNEYLLVGGFDRFHYLKKSTSETHAQCIIEFNNHGDKSRYIKILQRLFDGGDTNKQNRQMALKLAESVKINLTTIVKRTGFTKSLVNNSYKYNPEIESKYINEFTTEKTLNWIQSLTRLDPKAKQFLFNSAGLQVKNSKRLTEDSIKIIKKLLKQNDKFYLLSSDEQVTILNYAITFKVRFVDFLSKMIHDYLKVSV